MGLPFALGARRPLAVLFVVWLSPAFGLGSIAVDLNQSRYLGPAQSQQASNYTRLGLDLNLETSSPGFSYHANALAQGYAERQDEFYFGVPEFYLQPRRLAPGFSLTIGRQKRTWSKLDEQFSLGVWQPQLRWDYLRPVQQGLTGVFFDWTLSAQMRLTFFTSPMSLPDQGPQYRLDDGQFVSENRWFSPPQSRVQLFEGSTGDAPLYFEIENPSEEDLVMHSSFGMGLRYDLSATVWSQLNYAYKPRNQIHLGLECSNCLLLPGSTPAEVTVLIHPKIVNHHVATWELGFDRIEDRGWISVTGDFPQGSGMPAEYAEASLDSNVFVGGSYQVFVREWFRVPAWIDYSYLRSFTVRRPLTGGVIDSDEVRSSLDRYAFREVASVGFKFLLSQRRGRRLHLDARYLYSVPEQGGWISSQLDYRVGAMGFSFGFDFVGAQVDSDSSRAGLLSQYRANDRVSAGMTYVF
jgi:hypothetical protein